MVDLNWEAISAVAEGLGTIAVVASLLYVGRQFRHSSTYALESIYFQTAGNFSSSPENARVVTRGSIDFGSLTEEERHHYTMLLHNLFSAIEQIYLQGRRGLVNQESVDRILQVGSFYYQQPGFRTWWEKGDRVPARALFSPRFVAEIENGRDL